MYCRTTLAFDLTIQQTSICDDSKIFAGLVKTFFKRYFPGLARHWRTAVTSLVYQFKHDVSPDNEAGSIL